MFWDIFLFQVIFSCRRDKKFSLSEFIFLVLRKHSNIFLIWEHISQIKKIFLNKFWGICSVYSYTCHFLVLKVLRETTDRKINKKKRRGKNWWLCLQGMSARKRLIDSKAWCPLSFLLEMLSLQSEYKRKKRWITHCKSLKTYWEMFSWFEKHILKSRKYYKMFPFI